MGSPMAWRTMTATAFLIGATTRIWEHSSTRTAHMVLTLRRPHCPKARMSSALTRARAILLSHQFLQRPKPNPPRSSPRPPSKPGLRRRTQRRQPSPPRPPFRVPSPFWNVCSLASRTGSELSRAPSTSHNIKVLSDYHCLFLHIGCDNSLCSSILRVLTLLRVRYLLPYCLRVY